MPSTPHFFATIFFNQTGSGFKRINQLIRDIQRDPFVGIGKPEPLRHDLAGLWSRRIDGEHRLVYAVDGENIIIMQCRYHYDN
uniref:Putative mRNA interferase YoeB n=1 Tax=Candidatus Kentrum sp. DK TaxID=2126562 RepID=A0A450T8M7_9GAMM|nr:MAG: toxin YoeB [Candidatus Kentron sp. DK]